ncbi:MAG: PilZ domain-containing protein [Acidobacteria bacterium]|nr:PilZ domain-containing protein [Acidobacteriota bacterium]
MIDRRAGDDRRKFPRYSVNIEVEWEVAAGRKNGTLSDLSLEGCFVLCSGEVENGDRVRVFLPVSDGMKVQFAGEVVNHFYEIGFAVRFIDLGPAQKNFLENYLATLRS